MEERKRNLILLVLLVFWIYSLGAPMIFMSAHPAWIQVMLVGVGALLAVISLPLVDEYLSLGQRRRGSYL